MRSLSLVERSPFVTIGSSAVSYGTLTEWLRTQTEVVMNFDKINFFYREIYRLFPGGLLSVLQDCLLNKAYVTQESNDSRPGIYHINGITITKSVLHVERFYETSNVNVTVESSRMAFYDYVYTEMLNAYDFDGDSYSLANNLIELLAILDAQIDIQIYNHLRRLPDSIDGYHVLDFDLIMVTYVHKDILFISFE